MAVAGTNSIEPILRYQVQPEARVSLLINLAVIALYSLCEQLWYRSKKHQELVLEGKIQDRRVRA